MREIDKHIYEQELMPWLPPKIIDCHTHVALREHIRPMSAERIAANWALEVGVEQSWEELRAAYRLLFPSQEVSALTFGGVFVEVDIERNNQYVLSGTLDPANKARGLLVTRPEWDASLVAEGLASGFIGIKPYPDLAPEGSDGPSIYDFVPKSHLSALNDAGGVLMLHLPRAGRLADPDNIRELLEISDMYPAVKIIVAHIGRSFCLPTAQQGLPHFVDRPGIYFDTSANLNSDVFQYAVETIGPERILYGSDLPITLMRGVREHVEEKYINFTDEPYSWNTNRKSAEEEARYTFFLYEELRALIRAAEGSGVGKEGMERILYSNSSRLLGLS